MTLTLPHYNYWITSPINHSQIISELLKGGLTNSHHMAPHFLLSLVLLPVAGVSYLQPSPQPLFFGHLFSWGHLSGIERDPAKGAVSIASPRCAGIVDLVLNRFRKKCLSLESLASFWHPGPCTALFECTDSRCLFFVRQLLLFHISHKQLLNLTKNATLLLGTSESPDTIHC